MNFVGYDVLSNNITLFMYLYLIFRYIYILYNILQLCNLKNNKIPEKKN